MTRSLEEFARAKLAAMEHQQLRRTLFETERFEDAVALRDGKRLISFACNDYLNLSQHPEIKRAAIEATERYGVGSGASRALSD